MVRPFRMAPALTATRPVAVVTVLMTALAALAAVAVTAAPANGRLWFACLLVLALGLIVLSAPTTGVLVVMAFLPFVAMFRRLLIEPSGWTGNDPLLLVGPLIALLLVGRAAFRRREALNDVVGDHPRNRLTVMVLALLLFTVAEAVNPAESVSAGVTGLLFTAAPLLWYFVGETLLTTANAGRLLIVVVVIALAVSAYGLLQTGVGFPVWDRDWLTVTGGYTALSVGGSLRAFGTFSSAAEYGLYLSMGVITCAALAMRGQVQWLLALPPLAVALFLESIRTDLVLTVVAVLVIVALDRGSRRGAVAIMIGGTVLIGLAAAVSGSAVGRLSQSSTNPFVAHQLGGLGSPLDPAQSTLPLHFTIVTGGIVASLSHPLGLGSGATNLAGNRGQTSASVLNGTEVDVPNTFLDLGPIGGLLFVAIIVVTFSRAFGLALRGQSTVALVLPGFLVISLGQWLNGGYYASSPLLWLLIGWMSSRHQQNADALPT